MFTIEKISLSNYNIVIKSFKTSDAMHTFLSGKNNLNNQWQISNRNLKSGTYAHIAGAWHNVKTLPASMRAHTR